jgi:hypothetical protein
VIDAEGLPEARGVSTGIGEVGREGTEARLDARGVRWGTLPDSLVMVVDLPAVARPPTPQDMSWWLEASNPITPNPRRRPGDAATGRAGLHSWVRRCSSRSCKSMVSHSGWG